MKSFWICCVASLLAAAPIGAARKADERSPDELMNVLLGPRWAQWLVGPIGRLASDEEIETFLALADDEAAARFAGEFWARRTPREGLPGLTAERQYRQLAEQADRRFTEAAYPGRRSARGTIYVLYGEPDEIDYESARRARDGLLEVWRYGPESPGGLDGRSPVRAHYFIKDGDLTRFARPAELPRLIPSTRSDQP